MTSRLSKTEIHKLKKGDAEAHLQKLSLCTKGKRHELLERLMDYYYPTSKPLVTNIKEVQPHGHKPPSKSAIRIMKIKDIAEKLKEVSLPIDGDKKTLVQRLDEYYRPLKKCKLDNNKVPTQKETQETQKETQKTQETQETQETSLPPLHNMENITENPPIQDEPNNFKDVRLQIFEYNRQLIGICTDTLTIYEKINGEWEPTTATWNMEENCPIGLETVY